MTDFGKLPASERAWTALGAVQSVTRDERTLTFDCGGPRLLVTVLAANTVRVRVAPTGELQPTRSWAVAKDEADWQAVPFQVHDSAAAVEVETERLRVVVERSSARVLCFDKQGRPFAHDSEQGATWPKSRGTAAALRR